MIEIGKCIDPEQHRIGLSLRKVDSAAFADKDFKMMTAEFDSLDQPEEPEESSPSEESSSEETSADVSETTDTPDTEA